MQRVHEAAERQAAFQFVAPRQIRNVQHVGEHLLAAAPQDEAGVRARDRDQAADRVGDGPMISRGVQFAKRRQRLGHRLQTLGQFGRHAVRVKHARDRVILEQLLLADGEQRAVQRGIDRQLVLGPLDGGERGADGIDFLALVEGLAADQQVRNAARFERLDVLARDVLAEVQEAPEQQADVAGDNLSALAAGRDCPRALRRQQPARRTPPSPAAATALSAVCVTCGGP